MTFDTQRLLDLLEQTHRLAFFDIEALGLSGDYSTVLVVSVKPFGKAPITLKVSRPGDDKKLVKEAGDLLESFDMWAGYFSRGFDIPMLNTRRLVHGLPPIAKRPHLDVYWKLKSATNCSRRSQGHLLSWLKTPASKMSVSASDWAELPADPKRYMPTMVKRCESDVRGLEQLYRRTRHLYQDIAA